MKRIFLQFVFILEFVLFLKDRDMKEKPLISVIVPLYNYRKYIGYCIQSILNQTYTNFELIVVDDCSTDNSYEKAKKFKDKDKRVKVIKLNKNYGIGRSKNEGIILSKGKYIVTLDADDMMTKDSLEIRIKAAIKHNVPFVYANAYLVKDNISLKECYKIKNYRENKSIDIYNIHAQTVLIHRDIYKKFGLYDENLRSRSDREMWWRLFGKNKSEKTKTSYYHLEKFVAFYRFHRFSMWRKRRRKPDLNNKIIKMSEKAYKIRKEQGITIENTRFLKR